MPQKQIRHTRVSLESSIFGGNEHKRQSDQQPLVNGYLSPNAVNGGYLSLRAGSSKGQESALRDNGFEIISAATPLQARFEIERGRCGIFLTSYITPFAIYRDLANLFRRSCPNGLVIFLTEHLEDNIPEADILLSGEGPPEAVIQAIRSMQEMNTARLPQKCTRSAVLPTCRAVLTCQRLILERPSQGVQVNVTLVHAL